MSNVSERGMYAPRLPPLAISPPMLYNVSQNDAAPRHGSLHQPPGLNMTHP